MSASLNLSYNADATNFGNVALRELPVISNAGGTPFLDEMALSSGDNTITIVGTRVAVVLLFSVKPASAKLKGSAGDTGIVMHVDYPFVKTISGDTSFIVNVSGSATLRLLWI